MSILLVGGDKLGNIKDNLIKNGFDNIEHITGRKAGDKRFKIPVKTDLVLVFVDFVNHKITEIAKEESRKNSIMIAFSKRSWVHMERTIQECATEIQNVRKTKDDKRFNF